MTMTLDLACSIGIGAIAVVAGTAYGCRVALRGAARHDRIERAGNSILLGRSMMEAAYWLLSPLASFLVRAGVPAHAVTAASLVLGFVAAVAIALGHFGVAALVAAFASLADAVDGLVAREAGTDSPAGAVFDSTADRYVELFLIGGVAVYFRSDLLALVLSLLAIAGSFMVSYSSAKAEAFGVEVPRGAMRRAERSVLLFLGATLTPVAMALAAGRGMSSRAAVLPMLVAVGVVAVAANVSAVRRLVAVARRVSAPSAKDVAVSSRQTPTEPAAEPLNYVGRTAP